MQRAQKMYLVDEGLGGFKIYPVITVPFTK